MSLASWKKEFYRTPAEEVPKRYALQHSLKKWTGLLLKNRRKHRVFLDGGVLQDKNGNSLIIDGDSCALCWHWIHDCIGCPLQVQECKDVYAEAINSGKVGPMIRLIQKAIKRRKK